MTRQPLELKVCGTTSPADAAMLNGTAVRWCGIVVEADFSPRSLSVEQAARVRAATDRDVVVLLCDPAPSLVASVVEHVRPFAIQLQCAESLAEVARVRAAVDCEVWKAVHLPVVASQASPAAYVRAGADRLVLDSQVVGEAGVRFGGTGRVGDWGRMADWMAGIREVPVMLAGGIHAGNLHEAVQKTGPDGVDLCSGVERQVGHRDPKRLDELLAAWSALEPNGEPAG